MGNQRKKRANRRAQESKRSGSVKTVVVLLVVATAGLGGLWWWNTRHLDAKPAGTSSSVVASEFEKLKGRWLRPDGGYVLEVRSVDDTGVVDALYLNPRPIRVAKARASQDGGALKLSIELRDVNYPGSTYDLTYRSASDELTGNYFQAVVGQNFEVVFQRTD